MSAPVTATAKRYQNVFACLACGVLADSERSDAITCSPACRVAWHRSERRTQMLESLKSSFFEGVTPAKIARLQALRELRPDLADGVMAGSKYDWGGDVWRAYWDRMMQAVRMSGGGE